MSKQHQVSSSMISSVEYDEKSQILVVNFKTKGSQSYLGITPETFKSFMESPSKGKFFRSSIAKIPTKTTPAVQKGRK